MRRILITDKVEEIAQGYKDNLFSKHTNRNFVRPQAGLKALEDEIKQNKGAWSPIWMKYAAYLHNLRIHFDEIILLKPKQFEPYRKLYFGKLDKKQLTDRKWRGKNNDASFSELLVQKMHYNIVRSEDMIPCVRKLDIKACVYCNAQYTNTVDIEGGQAKGRYELDHFKPKDEYPFLCISFYNLQPCCGNCNKWKLDENAEFNLYTEDYEEMNPFRFELTAASMVRYMLRQDASVLEVKLKSKDSTLLKNHLERFHTDDLYKTYGDELEELVWKFKSFNESYKKQLVERFQRLFPYHATRNDIIRFLYGFYMKESEVHKRPLTKVKQDVAKQLEMI